MATGRHYHSSVATLSSLAAAMTSATTSDLVVPQATFVGYPGSYPYTVRLEGGTANEELIDIRVAPTVAGGNLTFAAANIDRGVDGSTAKAHAINSVVDHPVTARDLEEAGAHVAALTAMHGLNAGDGVTAQGGLSIGNLSADAIALFLRGVASAAQPLLQFKETAGQTAPFWQAMDAGLPGSVLAQLDSAGKLSSQGNLPNPVIAGGGSLKIVHGTASMSITSGSGSLQVTIPGLTTVILAIGNFTVTANTAGPVGTTSQTGNKATFNVSNMGGYTGSGTLVYVAFGT